MKRIQYHTYGDSNVMQLEAFELPSLKTGEVAVRVKAASINPVDWKIRRGDLKMLTGRSFPRPMGSDFSGTVMAVGSGVTHLKPGDPVFGLSRLKESGSFAEAIVTTESYVTLKPGELSFEQAACLPTAVVMAWNGLIDKADLKPGQRVFVNGCTGGIGEAVVQLALMLGSSVTGSCSADSIARARALGVELVYDYETTDVSDIPTGFDVVYDTAGTLSVAQGLRLLKRTGVFLDIHASPLKFLRAAFNRRLKLFFCTPRPEILDKAAQAAVAGKLRMTIGETVPLSEAIRLITDLEAHQKINGKGLIVME